MIEKLHEPYKEENPRRVVFHPTQEELTDKINELIDAHNELEKKIHSPHTFRSFDKGQNLAG